MKTRQYEILESDDVSTGIATRRRVYLTVTDGGDEVPVIRDVVRRMERERIDVGFVFVYDTPEDASHRAARIRARYIRKGAKGVPSLPWRGTDHTATERTRKGTVEIAWELVGA